MIDLVMARLKKGLGASAQRFLRVVYKRDGVDAGRAHWSSCWVDVSGSPLTLQNHYVECFFLLRGGRAVVGSLV